MVDPRVTAPERAAEMARGAPPVRAERPLARASALPWVLFLVALAFAAWLGWKAFGPDQRGDPAGVSAVALQKQNRLQVLRAALSTVTVKEDSRFFGTVKSTQIALIPATVDYYVDLSSVGRERVAWDDEKQVLTVRVPDIRVEQPNLALERARFYRQGLWITNAAQEKLVRENVGSARAEATRAATSTSYVELARNAARDAIRQNLAIPLQVAGFGNVTVNVRFDGEPAAR
jgi:hypothetical protein